MGRLFNGSIPIVLDTLKQHYFIDRDGRLFRHILNYLRCGRLVLPENFDELELLREEAKFYDIASLNREIDELWTALHRPVHSADGKGWSGKASLIHSNREDVKSSNHQCVLLSTSPDLGRSACIALK